jgi:DNA repair protein RadC
MLGSGALTDAELLAILLRTGRRGESSLALAQRLLARYEGLEGLAGSPFSEVESQDGMGLAKASQIFAAFELGRRMAGRTRTSRPPVRSAKDVYEVLGARLRDERRESFWVLLLDTRHRLQNAVRVSEGSLTMTLVHPREAFAPALRESAAAVLFVHNHPSGDPEPSKDDWSLTLRLIECGEILGIKVLDHVVLGDHAFVSLRDRGAFSDGSG